MDHFLGFPSALPMPAGSWQWSIPGKCSWQEEMGGQRRDKGGWAEESENEERISPREPDPHSRSPSVLDSPGLPRAPLSGPCGS